MDSPRNSGQGEKRQHDDDSNADPQSSPSKKQKGVENQEETLADVIKASKTYIATCLTGRVCLFLEEHNTSNPTQCRAKFCIPNEIRGRIYIDSSLRFRWANSSRSLYYHISCLEQMYDFSDLMDVDNFKLDHYTAWPKQIENWYARVISPGGEQPPRFLSEVLADLFHEKHIDCAAPDFLRYLRESEDGKTGISTHMADKRTEVLPSSSLQLPYSDIKALLKDLITAPQDEPLISSDYTPSELRRSLGKVKRQPVSKVIKSASPGTKLEMGGVEIGEEDISGEDAESLAEWCELIFRNT
jgi:hypothetical protein